MMVAMGCSDPTDVAAYDERLAHVTIGRPQRLAGPIEMCEYDPAWQAAYRREAARVCSALGPRVLRLEHVGSTSVPGLSAKPIIDIVLEVADSSDEPAYGRDLEAVGWVLRIREPDWYDHRLFKSQDGCVNLHAFSDACPETDRMVRFRDWLRSNAEDRELYAQSKRELASREWSYMQQYADAKTEVVTSIMSRAAAAPGSAQTSSASAVSPVRR